MRKYEIMYILDQDTAENTVKDTKAKLEKILTENGGKIEEQKEWGLMDFAYEINHKKKGFYFVAIVNTNAENIAEFQRVAKIDKNVVREMVINTEKEQDYVQSVELSKTDMTKFEEERKERRTFNKRNFNSRPRPENSTEENNNNSSTEPNKEA